MSGPKVINIEAVRRRQKQDSKLLLSKLELALAECKRWQAQPQAADSLKRLASLREAGQWASLLLEAGRLNEFYQEESHRLRQQHAAEQAAQLSRAHRLQQSVVQMTEQLQNLPPSKERDILIIQLTRGDSIQHESALNTATHFIGELRHDQSASRLSELAASLIDPAAETYAPTRLSAPADPHQQRLEKCWNLLGELSTATHSPEIEALFVKARHIIKVPAVQQALLLDSLALEISTHLQHQRATRAWREELNMLLSELDEVRSPIAVGWRQRLTTALTESPSAEANPKLLTESRAWIDQIVAEETREEQRAAVLIALAATGYEVREGMAAAWVEEGRIVLRKPSESTYGVELSAPAQGSIIQTRVVALSDSPRDPLRDREVEQTWCGEYEQARAILDDAGFKASLVKAQPAGSIPLKTIGIPLASDNNRLSLDLREKRSKNAG